MPEGALVSGWDDDDFRVRPLMPPWGWLVVLLLVVALVVLL